MPKKETNRSRQARETRNRIINAALTLFDETGFADTTIEMIAEKARVSVGSIYHYFSGKAQIAARAFDSLDEKYDEFYNKLMNDDLYRDMSGTEKLLEYFIFLQNATASLDYLNLAYATDIRNGAATVLSVTPNRSLYKVYEKILVECHGSDGFDDAFSDQDVIEMLTQLSRGILVDWMLHKKDFDIESQSRKMFKVFIKGVLKLQ